MCLIHNWKAVLRYAWSIRFLVLAAVLSGVEVALPLVVGMPPLSAASSQLQR